MDYSHLIASITPGKLENGVKDKAPAVETSLTISHGRKDLDLAELVEYKAGKRENLSLQVSFTLKDAGDKTERSAIGQLNIQLPDYPGTFVFGIPAQGGKHFPQVTQFITLQVNEPYVDGLTFELPEGRAPGLKTMQMALENVTELNALPEAAEDRKPISDKIKAMAGAAESQRKGMAEVAKAGNNRHKEVEKRFQDTEKKLAKLKEDEGNLPTWRDQSNELSKLNREIGKLRKELNKKAAALAEGEKARHTIQRLASKLGFKAIPGEEEFEKEMAEVNERLKKLNYNRYKQVEEALGEYVSKLKEEISTVGTQLEAARQALQSKNDPKNAEKVTELEAALEQKSAEIKMNEESLAGARKKIEEVEASEDGQRKKDLEELKKSLQSQQSGPGDELRIKQDSLAQMLTQRESLLSALQNGQIQLEEMSFRRNLLETEHKEDSRQLKQLEKLAQKIEAETSAWQLLVDQFKTEYKRLFEKELRDLPKDPKYVGEDSPWVTLLGKAAWWNAKADDLAGLAAALTPEGADLPDLNAFSDSASLALYLGQIAVNNQTKELDKLVQALGLNKEELLAADRMVSLQKMVVSALRSEKTDQREIESALKKGRRAFERPAAPDFRSPAAAVEQHIADYYRALPGLAKSMLEASLKGLKLSGPAAESLNKLLDGDILYAVLHGNANQKSAATRLLLRNSAEQAAGSIADNLLQILLQEGLESLSKEVSSKIKEIKRNFPELTFNADPVQLEELGGRTGESQFVFSGEDAGQGLALADALLALHLGAQWSKYLKTSFYLDTLTDHLRGLDSNEEVSPEVAAAFESHKNESLAEVLRRLNGAGQELAPVVEAWKGLTAPKGKALAAHAEKYAQALLERDEKYRFWKLSAAPADLEAFLKASRRAMALGGAAYISVGGRKLLLQQLAEMEKALNRAKLGWEGISEVWEKLSPVAPEDNFSFFLENLTQALTQVKAAGKKTAQGILKSSLYWERTLRCAFLSARPVDLSKLKASKTQTGATLYQLAQSLTAQGATISQVLAEAYPGSEAPEKDFLADLQTAALNLAKELGKTKS